MGFGDWQGLQSIGNGCGLQMDGFSAHFDSYGYVFDDFHDFGHFGVDSGGLTLLPKGPRTNIRSGSHHNFSGKVKNHENPSKLDPCSTSRAENQAF